MEKKKYKNIPVGDTTHSRIQTFQAIEVLAGSPKSQEEIINEALDCLEKQKGNRIDAAMTELQKKRPS